MRTQNSVRRCLLAATLAGTPLYVSAAESVSPDKDSSQTEPAALRPVVAAALKAVPQSNEGAFGIQQTQYRPDTKQTTHETPTVNAELQRLFYENGQSMPSMRPQNLSTTNGPSIRMIRHRNDAPESSALSDEVTKKPGLLQRFLNTFKAKTADEGDEFPTSDLTGQPAIPLVPPPPPIAYEEDSNAGRPGRIGVSVPARAAGYQKGNGQSIYGATRPRPANGLDQNSAPSMLPRSQVPPSNTPLESQSATRKPAGSDARHQQPPVNQVFPDDGFVDPFNESKSTDEENTLLDLDSLTNAPDVAGNEIPAPSPTQNARESIADNNPLVQEAAAVSGESQAPERDLTNNPLTGYRLDAVGQVSRQQSEKSTTSSPASAVVADVPPARALPGDEEPEAAIGQTPGEGGQTADPEKSSQIVRIPLLEQEDESSPSVTSKAAWTSSAKAVPKGRELATPIELKPDPERLRQLSDKARREAQLYRIMSRTGQTGFKGFCPVALRNQRELLDGRDEYQSRFGLKTYYFSSPEARDAFEANPARYAPAGSGNDVVLLVNTNEEVAGILDYSLWYRDRLYMFRSRETQAIFSGDPQKYASQY